tara:strand:+ start:43850 stop:45946 length:2097 start_codon:yes stop_codon:yes gene_type:complete
MNRYSRVAPSQFNPLSLQEVMAVPLARQQNHDNTMAQIDKLGLFDINRLQQDEEGASGFINDYTDKLSGQADQIMQGGVDQNTMREMMKLKSERDKFLLNDGKKMEAAFNANKENVELAGKMLQSGKIDAQRYSEIVDHAKKQYKGIKDGPYENYLGAENFDYTTQARNLAKDVDKEKLMELYGLEQDDYGMLRYSSKSVESPNIRRNADGSISYEDVVYDYTKNMLLSDPKLKSDLNHIRTVGGEEAAQDYLNQIEQVSRSVNSSKDVIKENYSQNFIQNPLLSGSGTPKEKTPMGVILNNREFSPHELSGKGYTSVSSRFKELDAKKDDLSKEEYAEYQQVKMFKDKVDEKLKDDPIYQKFKQAEKIEGGEGVNGTVVSRMYGSLNSGEQFDYDKLDDGTYQMYKNFTTGSGADQRDPVGEPISKDNYNLISQYETYKKHVDQKTKDITLQFTGYQLVPRTAAQNTSLGLMNETIENVFKTSPENIKTMVNLESLFANNQTYQDLDSGKQDAIAQAIYNSPPGKMQLVSVIPKGFSQKPEYVLRVIPDKEFKADLDSTGFFRDDTIGEGQPFDIRVSFNEVDNGIVNTVNGYLEDYVKDSGDGIVNPVTGKTTNVGKEMQADMKRNRLLSNYNGTKFSDLTDISTPDHKKIPNFLLQEMKTELYKYGLNPNERPTDDQLNIALQKYFKENKRFYGQ